MVGLIEEIQRDASTDSVSVAQLLRRMKIAASKLRLVELGEWVGHELGGYPETLGLPEYRRLVGVPCGFSRFHGWRVMALGPDETVNRAFSVCNFSGSIAEVEAMAAKGEDVLLSFPEFLERMSIQMNLGTEKIGISIGHAKFVAILSAVRDKILDWALALEEAGVTGCGMTFTQEDRSAALVVTNHIYGNNARINHASTDSSINSSS